MNILFSNENGEGQGKKRRVGMIQKICQGKQRATVGHKVLTLEGGEEGGNKISFFAA